MKREYIQKTVYEAVQERFEFLFQEFENIYVSFSGGKDSGLLLNLLMDFKRAYYPDRVIGLFHQDFEAQYTVTVTEENYMDYWRVLVIIDEAQ